MRALRGLLAVCILATAAQALSLTLLRGDIVVATYPSPGVQHLLVYAPNGVLKGTLAATGVVGQLAGDAQGALYAAVVSPSVIQKFSPDGSSTQFPAAATFGLVADATSSVYGVNVTAGIGLNASVKRYDTLGAATTVVTFPSFAGGIDLDSTQCRLYIAGYLTEFDVCQHTLRDIDLGSFNPNLGPVFDVRLLDDDRLLIAQATELAAEIDRNGTLLRQHSFYAPRLALALDKQSVWTVSGTSLVRYNLATDAEVQRIDTGVDLSRGPLAVIGEPRAALSPANVPAVSPIVVLLLALALAGVAISRPTSGA